MDYNPGDIVHIKRDIGDDRYYFIQGTCFGAENQRDVVALSFADDRSPPTCENDDGDFESREVLHIPVALFEAALESQRAAVYERFEDMPNPVYG
jgi:hypothetical protein